MSMQQGFIDLRLNHQRDQSAESFWPSFTDIMTVVVMIFMLAMLILLVRNMELVRELRSTAAAEHAAADLARAKDAERAKLAEGLTAAQASLRRLSSQLDAAAAAARAKDRQLVQQRERLEAVSAERETLRSKLEDQQAAAAEMKTRLQAATARVEVLNQKRAKLQAQTASQAAELTSALEKLAVADRSHAELAETYDELKARYNRLVRPARSPQGRYLVEVRYSKNGRRGEIQMRDGGDASFHTVDRSTLDKRLSELTKAHPEGLYVKVIFPKNSGLSYSEAWQFTSALHSGYDYYYRDQGSERDQRAGEGQ
jgi:myosin heavy subunit